MTPKMVATSAVATPANSRMIDSRNQDTSRTPAYAIDAARPRVERDRQAEDHAWIGCPLIVGFA
jgi:hypothetical protein